MHAIYYLKYFMSLLVSYLFLVDVYLVSIGAWIMSFTTRWFLVLVYINNLSWLFIIIVVVIVVPKYWKENHVGLYLKKTRGLNIELVLGFKASHWVYASL